MKAKPKEGDSPNLGRSTLPANVEMAQAGEECATLKFELLRREAAAQLRTLLDEMDVKANRFCQRLGIDERLDRAVEDLVGKDGLNVSAKRLKRLHDQVERAPIAPPFEATRRAFLFAAAEAVAAYATSLDGGAGRAAEVRPSTVLNVTNRETFDQAVAMFSALPPSQGVQLFRTLEDLVAPSHPTWAAEVAERTAFTLKTRGRYEEAHETAERAIAAYSGRVDPGALWDLIVASGIASLHMRNLPAARQKFLAAQRIEKEGQVAIPDHQEPAEHWLGRIDLEVASTDPDRYGADAARSAARRFRHVEETDLDSKWHPIWAVEALVDLLENRPLTSDEGDLLVDEIARGDGMRIGNGTEILYLPLQRARAKLNGLFGARSVDRSNIRPEALLETLDLVGDREWATVIAYGLCVVADAEIEAGRFKSAIETLAAAEAVDPNHRLLRRRWKDIPAQLNSVGLSDSEWDAMKERARHGQGVFKYPHLVGSERPARGVERMCAIASRGRPRR